MAAAGESLAPAWEGTKQAVGSVSTATGAGDAVGNVLQGTKQAVEKAGEAVAPAWEGTKQAVGDAGEKVMGHFGALVHNLSQAKFGASTGSRAMASGSASGSDSADADAAVADKTAAPGGSRE